MIEIKLKGRGRTEIEIRETRRRVKTKKGTIGIKKMIRKIRKKTDQLLSHLGNLQGEMLPKIESLMIMGANLSMGI